ncbi:hypothetical protein K1728_12050 (plasmid) [Weissella confusa]|uniref:hypothetical protein n=1 Tax=Weissella confusa TaxID=1583 RepID=UPI001C6F5FC7|nr:hypothetical protein [Weissella confusa]QYU58996.1 hypothetical protein K1728_12050 [Weissella confusa]
MAIGYASYKEGILALLIELIALVLLAVGGARLYGKNVLSYGETHLFRGTLANIRRTSQNANEKPGSHIGLQSSKTPQQPQSRSVNLWQRTI